MVLVAITIRAEPQTDTANRTFGLAIDQTLNPNFTETQPEKILKNPDGSWLITNIAFTYSTVLNLDEGTHTIRFAPSSPSGYTWKATIVINRINSLGEQTNLTSENQYSAQFTIQAPTWEKVRKAIHEADRYLERLYQTVDWSGKTYGIIKSCPFLPLSLKINRPPLRRSDLFDYYNEDKILGPGYPYHAAIGQLHSWMATSRVVSVKEPEFETYEATIEIGANQYHGYDRWFPIAKLYIKYGPDPNDPTRMMAEIELLGWYKYGVLEEDVQGDIYLGAEPDPNRPGLFRPRKIIPNAHVNVGTKVTLTTPSWGCFPCNSYWLGETYEAALYWWHQKLSRRLVHPYMTSILDDYGLKIYIRGPTFLGTRNDYPDDWLCLTDEHNRICDVWESLPRNEYCSSHWSTLCGPGAIVLFDKYPSGACVPCLVSKGKASCLDCDDFNLAVLPQAITIMCKHYDPKKKVWDGAYTLRPVYPEPEFHKGQSAEEYLLTGYLSCACDKWHPPFKELVYRILNNQNPWEPDQPINGQVTIWFLAEALAAFSILGYGFEYEEAKLLADALADWILELQWGVKPGEEGKGRLYVLHHDVWTSFTVNRPDHRGGFYHRYAIVDDKIHWVTRPPRDWLQELLISFFGWEPPGCYAIFTPTSTEGTIVAVAALRIYEYYKWRVKT